jgi:outer membrane translocation and assembly module TamA
VHGGVSTSELKPLTAGLVTQHANAFVAGVGFDQTWNRYRTGAQSSSGRRERESDGEQRVVASYELRAGLDGLDSDLNYRRHLGHVRFRAERGDTTFIADFRAGGITGRAPLFERFTLGDSTTLRGWNKYDIAPAGADRMWHQTVEFRYHVLAYFFDAGSLWDSGTERKTRLGTGFAAGPLVLAFPLNADDGDPTFIFNLRFGVGF